MFHRKNVKCLILCSMILSLLSLCACGPKGKDVDIFASMEECQIVEDQKTEEAEVEILDAAKKDRYLQELEPEESFACKYISDEMTFTLYAYVFTDSDHAMEYYENATGKKSDRNPTFTSSSGMGVFSRIVVNENKAYTVWCSKSDSEDVIELLNSWFSVDVYFFDGN